MIVWHNRRDRRMLMPPSNVETVTSYSRQRKQQYARTLTIIGGSGRSQLYVKKR